MTAISPSADKKAAVSKFAEDLEIEGRSLWADARDRFFRNRAAVVSLIILACIGVLVIIGPWLSPS